MKAKHALILLILGYCLDFIGSTVKIMHHLGGDEILITATVLKVMGSLLLLSKLVSYPKLKDFFDY
ncbi:MAG: hypothetical protein JST68_23155 [Bacteroidetes bacterium]|nr:hypothetical protein [Bacteroidota bacterium]